MPTRFHLDRQGAAVDDDLTLAVARAGDGQGGIPSVAHHCRAHDANPDDAGALCHPFLPNLSADQQTAIARPQQKGFICWVPVIRDLTGLADPG